MLDEVTRALVRPEGRRVLEAVVFPAADRRAVAQFRAVRPALAVIGTEAVCFYHGHLKATAACDECGGYLCAMCALPIGGQTVCPNCVVQARAGRKPGVRTESRPLWGWRAVSVMVLGLVFPPAWFVLPLISIGVLWMVWRCWSLPGSLVRPGRGSLIAAAVLAVLALAGGLMIWFGLFAKELTSLF